MEDQWLSWAKQLQGIASTGVHFSEDPYDTVRYEQVADIANAMLAALGSVPVDRIESLVSDFGKGYATPKIDVRGAVIDDGKVLLVREASDGLWTLPGGYADVGISPSENVVKEIWEEASLKVSATALYAVRHKARHDYDQDARDFYKLFFLCMRMDDAVATPSDGETTEAEFFYPQKLPALSTGRVLAKDIAGAFEFQASRGRAAAFD